MGLGSWRRHRDQVGDHASPLHTLLYFLTSSSALCCLDFHVYCGGNIDQVGVVMVTGNADGGHFNVQAA